MFGQTWRGQLMDGKVHEEVEKDDDDVDGVDDDADAEEHRATEARLHIIAQCLHLTLDSLVGCLTGRTEALITGREPGNVVSDSFHADRLTSFSVGQKPGE